MVKVGTTEKKLGQAERDLKAKSMSQFLHQLKSFLEGDMKTITVSIGIEICRSRINCDNYNKFTLWDLHLYVQRVKK